MNLLHSAIAQFVPGGQLLGAVLTRVGASQSEQDSVAGLYTHLKATPIGGLLPANLDLFVKMLAGGKGALSSMAPLLSDMLTLPGAKAFAAKQIDSVLSSYSKIDDVMNVAEKAAGAEYIPASSTEESPGEYIIRVMTQYLPEPEPAKPVMVSIHHSCPSCGFAHMVHAGEQA